MDGRLIYIGNPQTDEPEPVIQVSEGQKAIITSIRVCAPTNNNGTYEIHHLTRGETAVTTANTIAFNVGISSKDASEFLTHPMPVSAGEAVWVSGTDVVIAVYGVTYP